MQTTIHQLTQELKYASSAYYVHSAPVMTDADFDSKLRTLESLEERFPQFAASDSPTRVVGSDLNGEAPKLVHPCPMRSLRNIGTKNDLLLWMYERLKETDFKAHFMLEKKYDGVSVEAVYRNGRYLQACTRGDGYEGTDISENIRRILPQTLKGENIPSVLVLRGEVVLPLSQLKRINAEGGSYMSARNAVSAFVLHDSPETFAQRGAEVYFYQAMGEGLPDTHSRRVSMIEEWGLKNSRADMTYWNPKDLIASIQDHENLRFYNDYDTDGVVVKVEQEHLRRTMKDTEKNYGWAVSYKFEKEQAYAPLWSVTKTVGRTGQVNFTAFIPPTRVGDVTVMNISLNSLKRVKELDLHEGDMMRVVLGGDCIPYVESVDENQRKEGAKPVRIPARCPECGEPLEQRGETLYCNNYHCYGRFRGRMLHFCKMMGYKGITEAMIEKIHEEGETRFTALYTSDYEELRGLGLTKKTAEKMLVYTESARKKPFATLLEAIAVPGIDRKDAKKIAASVPSLCELKKLVDNGEISCKCNLSEKKIQALSDYFTDEDVLEDLEYLV